MSIIVNLNDDIISGSINAEVFGRTFDQVIYDQMLVIAEAANKADTVKEYKEMVEEFKKLTEEDISGHLGTFHNDIFIDRKTGEYFLKHNGVISSVPMPSTMVERIKTSLDKKIDISPLLKAWIRFLRNPKNVGGFYDQSGFAERFFNFIDIKFTNHELVDELMEEKGYSQEVAEKMATTYSMKLTNEGLLAGFKVSKEITKRYKLNEKGEKESFDVYQTGAKSIDPISGLITTEKVELSNEERVFEPAVYSGGDDFFCNDKLGYIIKVGATHRLPGWNDVNCNDEQSCVKGLHVGGLDYIRGYQGGNTSTHNVFIDPAHIGAIPDCSTGAIRCIQYFVCDEFSGVNGSIYHSSKYAAQTDEQWNVEKDEIIKKYGEYKKQMIDHQTEQLNLIGSL